MTVRTTAALLLALPLALPLGACVAAREPPPVPPVPAERIPTPPESPVTLIWQPGHWDWDGDGYRWDGGRWVARSGHGPLWQDGFWRRRGASFVWEPAHWM